MPHSSGGGHGGGFHGGGGFHSGSHGHSSSSNDIRTVRYSRTYFTGAYCFIYYDRLFRPHTIYSDSLDDQKRKPNWITILVYALMMLVPLIFIFFQCFHMPKMIKDDYNTKIIISDQAEVLSDEEEANLKVTFESFFDKTGITPSFVSTKGLYRYELEDFAYSFYVDNFKDEKHWLIAYSEINERSHKWFFEGMQGNDTDPVLTTYQTDKFNKALQKALANMDNTVYQAFDKTFNDFSNEVMKPYFYMDIGMIVFTVIWVAMFGCLIALQVNTNIRLKHINESTAVMHEEPRLEKCPYCDTPYYAYSIETCPKCGGVVDYPKSARNNPEYKDPEF